ncbi:uncharacterized protein [Zea mays]|uniref:Uncharacterized protein n=1 Tax=Zea mays TaxID=4577 RepID=B6TW88_MAIZE|nr:uncharacterized protein LOC100277566 [Zea mays]ACG41371.1 hypothetical protein [Zea mays]AQK46513.1 hypothetical protein ZEAMMB73_Zm00001d026412 [Zea mays]|eukprot:XP_008663643.1 uncharacterized protein LOC100277566 [Zea mays]
MANLAAQIKDKFLGLVDRVTDAAAGFGRAAGGKDDDVQDPTTTKLHLHAVQRAEVIIRSRGGEPVVDTGSTAGAN